MGIVFTSCLLVLLAQSAGSQQADPRKNEVRLKGTGADWDGFLLWRGGPEAGVWSVGCVDVFREYGCPEVVGLDDKGRVVALVSYSGKWTPTEAVHDGSWLGSMAHLDLDPRVPGSELYTGGRSGNLYRVTPRMGAHGAPGLDSVEIGHFRSDEIHAMAGGELLPSRPGPELLVFTLTGQVCDVRPQPAGAEFDLVKVGGVPGRVRDAVVLPAAAGAAPWVATVSRAGDVMLVRLKENGLDQELVAHEAMGLGRVALRPNAGDEALTLYVTRDDGAILRLGRERGGAAWTREQLYAGPQGPRGIVAGRFHADPKRESVAVFGYSKRVEIVSRVPGGAWEVELVLTDQDQGHWLARAEVDGRNATDELLASGFGGQIVLLSRPPGHGLPGVPADGAGSASRPAPPKEGEKGWRIGAKGADDAAR